MSSSLPTSRKALVTGAAGFIGSHLCDRLLAEGWTVVGIDDLSLGRPANLKLALAQPGFQFLAEDLNNTSACEGPLRAEHARAPFDTVWHLAANSDIQAGVKDPQVDLGKTFATTFNTLRYCRLLGIPRLVFASTSAVYGNLSGELHEDTGPLFPISNYGAMKLASEGLISAALETHLRQAWICRFPNVVGPRATHGAIYDFVNKLKATPGQLTVLGDGCQEKPYLHVDDLLEAMFFIYTHAGERLNYFNISEGRTTTTVRELAEAVVAVVNPKARIHYTGGAQGWPGDVPKFRYSTRKLTALGWQPRLNSRQAVELAVRQIAKEILG